jgi:hypothetical protein
VLGCYLWLEPTTAQSEFEETVFKKFEFSGITDNMVKMREKEVVREDDREIETETSKSNNINNCIEMSMIVGCMVNCMLAYMSMNHFQEAEKVAQFLISNNYFNDPEIHFRKA